MISVLRIFFRLRNENLSPFAAAFWDLKEFLFWPPSKMFQEKFKLIVFVYEDPYSSLSIKVEVNESPFVKFEEKVLLIKIFGLLALRKLFVILFNFFLKINVFKERLLSNALFKFVFRS